MVIVHVLEPFATGINTFINELVHSMPDDQHIIIHGERKESRDIEEIKLEYPSNASFIPWKNAQREISLIYDIKAFLELKKKLKKIEFDILHLHSSKAGILGRMVAYINGYKKVVYTPNAASFLRTDISSSKRKFYIKLEKFFNRIPSIIVSASKSEQNQYKKIGINTRLIKNGVTVIPNKPKKIKDTDVITVIFCANITTQKRPELFNEVAEQFIDDKKFKFKWIGGGELRASLTSKNIEVTDWKSKQEVYESLSKANIYLSTSAWEGLSLSTIEALGAALPIVLSDCLGNIDFIETKNDGFLYSSIDEAVSIIKQLANDPKLYEEMSLSSLANYQNKYSNFKCGREYKTLYESLNKND